MDYKPLIIDYEWLYEDKHFFSHWLPWKLGANSVMFAPAFHLNKQSFAWAQVSGLVTIGLGLHSKMFKLKIQ